MSKETEQGKKILDSIIHKITLGVFRIGCDEANYRLLEFCSKKTSKQIQATFKMSPMSVSRRTKAMIGAGLLKKDNQLYTQSELGKSFLELIKEAKKNVENEAVKLVDKQ